MKQNTATTTNKEATPEAQNRLEDVHKMTPFPAETGCWKLHAAKEISKNKWNIIQSKKTKQTNKEGLGEVRWPQISRKGPPHLNSHPKIEMKKTNTSGMVKWGGPFWTQCHPKHSNTEKQKKGKNE